MFKVIDQTREAPEQAARRWALRLQESWRQRQEKHQPTAFTMWPMGEVTVMDVQRLAREHDVIGGIQEIRQRPFQSATLADLLELVELRTENSRLRRQNDQLRTRLLAPEGARTKTRSEPLIEVAGHSLPQVLQPVAERLDRSRGMLALGDNWDDEGSPGYAEATWHRAAEIVVGTATAYHRSGGGVVPLPVITKGEAGSIDVQWRTSTRNILISVPAEPDEAVSFYAHDRENEDRDIEGKLNPSADNGWLLRWLTA